MTAEFRFPPVKVPKLGAHICCGKCREGKPCAGGCGGSASRGLAAQLPREEQFLAQALSNPESDGNPLELSEMRRSRGKIVKVGDFRFPSVGVPRMSGAQPRMPSTIETNTREQAQAQCSCKISDYTRACDCYRGTVSNSRPRPNEIVLHHSGRGTPATTPRVSELDVALPPPSPRGPGQDWDPVPDPKEHYEPAPIIKFVWPFPVDCQTEDLPTVPFRYWENGCLTESRRARLRFHHNRAYRIAVLARRTLRYMNGADVIRSGILWSWGTNTSEHSWLWGKNPDSRFAGLAHWFGDYTPSKMSRISTMFESLVQWFEEGGVNHVAGNGGGPRDFVIYWCGSGSNWRHPDQRHTEMSKHTWSSISEAQFTGKILHESMHNLLKLGVPKDEKDKVCVGYRRKCYSLGSEDKTWEYGKNPNNPRRLVEAGEDDKALNNIDNYVSWAIRRFNDPQFGNCGAPRPNRKGRNF